MRTLQWVLLLITTVVLTVSWLPGGGSPAPALASPPVSSIAAERLLIVADASGSARPASSGDDLEFLPQGARHDEEPSPVGWFLIVCAIVLFVVIIGFIIRHHRSGRAG